MSKSSLLQRSNILIDKALEEDSTAQHSLGLLYHMGYGGVLQSDEYSTKWHAISALYGNIDAIAVLGGCLRKGSGIKQNKELGLELIYYAAEKLSPFGLVKKAHVIEQEEGEGKAQAEAEGEGEESWSYQEKLSKEEGHPCQEEEGKDYRREWGERGEWRGRIWYGRRW